MNASLTLACLIAAGVGLVVQNTLMVRITQSASTILIAMLLNSLVGIVIFVTMLLLRQGVAGFQELALSVKWWTLIPGLLGSFFVFASISGYQNVGAATTIAVLVASQLVGGLIMDLVHSGRRTRTRRCEDHRLRSVQGNFTTRQPYRRTVKRISHRRSDSRSVRRASAAQLYIRVDFGEKQGNRNSARGRRERLGRFQDILLRSVHFRVYLLRSLNDRLGVAVQRYKQQHITYNGRPHGRTA